MTEVKRGCLVIADIGGYTKYLSGVELEHSQDILADLIGSVVEGLAPGYRLAKLEGDAVFCFSEDEGPDPHLLIASIDSAYFSFMRRQRNILSLTTCRCDACRHIPDLHLKFAIHHGAYVQHDVAGHRELVGADVIVVHRLLKNSIVEVTGLNGYAFLTQRCIDLSHLDPAPLGMIEHRENYGDVGEVAGWVLDMERRWAEEQAREDVKVTDEAAWVSVHVDVEGVPAAIWDLVTSPERQMEWAVGVTGMSESMPAGLRGAGASVHCMHGDGTSTMMEIVDWKPFRYYTVVARSGDMPESLWTTEIASLEDGLVRVSKRARLKNSVPGPELEPMRTALLEVVEMGFANLAQILTGSQNRQTG